MKPDLVAILGDLQYQVGQYSDFEGSYDLTYGAFKMITRPAPGNHEFYDEHSATGVAGYGYFSYFNGFQIDATGAPVTATIPDPCPSGLGLERIRTRRTRRPRRPARAAIRARPRPTPNLFHGRMDRQGTSRSRLTESEWNRRWLVLVQSGHVAPYFAQDGYLLDSGFHKG